MVRDAGEGLRIIARWRRPDRLAGITDTLRLILEIGKTRKVVGGGMDWPGLDRLGTSEDDAIDRLSSYLPRYADVPQRAGLKREFAQAREIEVERVPRIELDGFLGRRPRVVEVGPTSPQ